MVFEITDERYKIVNLKDVESTILPGGERVRQFLRCKASSDIVEMGTAMIDPGEGFSPPGYAERGELDGCYFGEDRLEADELVYHVRGELTFYLDDPPEKFTVRGGDFLFIRKGTKIKKAVNEGTETLFSIVVFAESPKAAYTKKP